MDDAQKVLIAAMAISLIGIVFYGFSGMSEPNHHYRIVGTNVTCTGNINHMGVDMVKQYCGYSFTRPCSDGAKYSCVSVAEVD